MHGPSGAVLAVLTGLMHGTLVLMSSPHTILVVSDEREFTGMRAAWTDLLRRSVDANTFMTHSWLHGWWTAYRPSGSLCIVTVEREGALVGIAPMMTTREGGIGRLLRRLRFIGDGTSETDHMNLIVDTENREATVSALIEGIDSINWDIAYFSQMPEASSNTRQLLRTAADLGWTMDSATSPCPRCVLPDSSEALMRLLPSRLRTAIRSSRRALATSHSVQFGRHLDSAELPSALETLYRNHASRWEAKGEAGVFVDPRKRSFYSELSRDLLRDETLHFYYLKVDGQIVAQQFCFEHDGVVYLLQEGFDAAWAERNVGNVLRFMVLEHLIESGRQVYDFLAGTSRHKRQWSNDVVNDLNIRFFRPTAAGRIALGVVAARTKLRNLMNGRVVGAEQ